MRIRDSDMVTVYVVTKKYSHRGNKKQLMRSYSYNSDGLLYKVKAKHNDPFNEFEKFYYNSDGNITKVKFGYNNETAFIFNYIYDSKGFLATVDASVVGEEEDDEGIAGQADSYDVVCDKKGYILQVNPFEYKKDGSKKYSKIHRIRYKYDKKGHITWCKSYYTSKKYDISKYYYNKKHDIKTMKDSDNTFRIKIKYNKKGLITKTSGDGTYTYKYKKIKVKRSLLPKVKAQRWYITNYGLNNAFIEESVI